MPTSAPTIATDADADGATNESTRTAPPLK